MILAFVFAAAAAPGQAGDVTYRFEWQGAGGYVMQGRMSFDVALLGKRYVLEDDLSCFEISGTKDGVPVGRWALGMLLPETTWRLTFAPTPSEFVVFGEDFPMPQAWNMDGFGRNCGDPGFGFNIGGAAQDLCVDGALIVASQVPPPRPMPVERANGIKFASDACRAEALLSGLY
ncbi:hypothetical protein AIOL_003445 [Candidatus Rhodobacter oscarellae]|uniref:Uncharacterized protein n=2 Tax=Candidatus Rhodobacter oscarellae TaxID=1675527 RepID=A0A0J9E6R8_9RHOB|nr:hypothetical protein AIOL_003445 [Candidatus Rhodobacter lobularis]